MHFTLTSCSWIKPSKPTSALGPSDGNEDPKPFNWTTNAEQIFESIGRLLQVSSVQTSFVISKARVHDAAPTQLGRVSS